MKIFESAQGTALVGLAIMSGLIGSRIGTLHNAAIGRLGPLDVLIFALQPVGTIFVFSTKVVTEPVLYVASALTLSASKRSFYSCLCCLFPLFNNVDRYLVYTFETRYSHFSISFFFPFLSSNHAQMTHRPPRRKTGTKK